VEFDMAREIEPLTQSTRPNHRLQKEGNMLRWALGFFIIALIAAVFGFGGVAVAAAGMAKILFFIFVILSLVALLGSLMRRV
jgi:uncharacterized membrane protein YtjA (UPF0391 family)